MTILDFIHPHATHTAEETQPVTPVIEEPSIEETVAPPAIVEPTPEVKKDEPVLTPEDTAASTVIEPLKDDVNKQPTLTHAEAGTEHTETEPATTVDGIPAEVAAEEPAVPAAEPATEVAPAESEPKVAAKEKVEKVKSESKGFFAKIFGSKDKSPKAKKAKTPKTEKADPLAAAPVVATPAPVATEETAAPTSESAAPIEPVKETVVEPEAAAPVLEAPVAVPASTSSPKIAQPEATATPKAPVVAAEAAVVPETAAVSEPTATTAHVAELSTTAPLPVKEETAKSPKPNRRLSARFTGFLKNVTKKDQVTKDEPAKEASTETPAVVSTESTEVAEQAPKIAEPTPTEPLSIVEPKSTETTAPIVSTIA